jgi:hypothetical protein
MLVNSYATFNATTYMAHATLDPLIEVSTSDFQGGAAFIFDDSLQLWGWCLDVGSNATALIDDNANGVAINVMNYSPQPGTISLAFDGSHVYFNGQTFAYAPNDLSAQYINSTNPITQIAQFVNNGGSDSDWASITIQPYSSIPNPSVPSASTLIFEDGFETGAPSTSWTSVSLGTDATVTSDLNFVHSGTYGLDSGVLDDSQAQLTYDSLNPSAVQNITAWFKYNEPWNGYDGDVFIGTAYCNPFSIDWGPNEQPPSFFASILDVMNTTGVYLKSFAIGNDVNEASQNIGYQFFSNTLNNPHWTQLSLICAYNSNDNFEEVWLLINGVTVAYLSVPLTAYAINVSEGLILSVYGNYEAVDDFSYSVQSAPAPTPTPYVGGGGWSNPTPTPVQAGGGIANKTSPIQALLNALKAIPPWAIWALIAVLLIAGVAGVLKGNKKSANPSRSFSPGAL